MGFADLKNDYIFRRIFGTHPDILRGLLNDLLERRNAQTIEQIEYLLNEQRPVVEGAKLSVMDVQCEDRAGTTFVVKIQLIHHPGFVNRFVYNACTYADPLKESDWYTKLPEVVVISIYDFALWPDQEQDKQGLPRVPMLSRWNMTERAPPNHGLLQVQHVFLELPKAPDRRPEVPGADLWAWLFAHAPELTEIPADLTPGPYRDALELANKAKFTVAELQAYEKARDEIRQVLEIADARWKEGEIAGEIKGEIKGKIGMLLAILEARGITVSTEARGRIDACKDSATLDRWSVRAITAGSLEEVFAAPREERA